MERNNGIVQKGWGYENIWVSNDKYCGKFLHFNTGAKFSMHFHAQKEESWYVLSGKFKIITIDTETSKRHEIDFNKDDVYHVMPLVPHQLICVEEGVIIEVSTPDSIKDNYRVEPGNSQV